MLPESLRSINNKVSFIFPAILLVFVGGLLAGFYFFVLSRIDALANLDPQAKKMLIYDMQRFVRIASGLLVGGTIFFVLYMRKWGLVSQLKYIMKSIRKISEGRVTGVEVHQGLSTELIDISFSINSMMKRLAMSQSKLEQRESLLRSSKEELEQRVEERTLEVEDSKRALEQQKAELIATNSQLESKTQILEEKTIRQDNFSEFLSCINSIEIETIIGLTLQKILEVCKYHFVVVYLYDEHLERLEPVYEYAVDYGRTDHNKISSAEGLPMQILNSDEWIKIDNFDDLSQPEIDLGVAKIKINNLYGIPLLFGQKKLGVMILGGLQKVNEESMTFLKDCIGPLCSALSNALSFQLIQVQTDNLKSANSQLEQASHLKDQFLANVSHEIRTPLNGIIGMTNLVRNTKMTPEQEEYLRIIKSSADSLLTLINDILDLSKIEAGQMELEDINFDLVNLVETVLEPISFNNPKPGLEIYYQIQTGIPEKLVGDPTRLKQILINLVGNAAKFTKHGRILVDVTCDGVEKDEARIHFKVVDSGIGISKEALRTIFESFTQADGSISRKYGGTGLGTTISRQLVTLMDGRIWVDSEINVGTTFEFVVPLKIQPGISTFVNPIPEFERRKLIIMVGGQNDWQDGFNKRMKALGLDSVAFPNREGMIQWLGTTANHYPKEMMLIFCDLQIGQQLDMTFIQWLYQQGFPREQIVVMVPVVENNLIGTCRSNKILFRTKPLKRDSMINLITGKTEESDVGEGHYPIKNMVLNSNLKILLAEDNLINQKLAQRLLEGTLTLDIAGTGLEAIQKFQQFKYDLILMDVQMPEMGGLEATVKIREMEKSRGSRIPIVAMTAHAMKGDRDKCIAAGMDDYITKPILPENLYQTIHEHTLSHQVYTGTVGLTSSATTSLAGDESGIIQSNVPEYHPSTNQVAPVPPEAAFPDIQQQAPAPQPLAQPQAVATAPKPTPQNLQVPPPAAQPGLAPEAMFQMNTAQPQSLQGLPTEPNQLSQALPAAPPMNPIEALASQQPLPAPQQSLDPQLATQGSNPLDQFLPTYSSPPVSPDASGAQNVPVSPGLSQPTDPVMAANLPEEPFQNLNTGSGSPLDSLLPQVSSPPQEPIQPPVTQINSEGAGMLMTEESVTQSGYDDKNETIQLVDGDYVAPGGLTSNQPSSGMQDNSSPTEGLRSDIFNFEKAYAVANRDTNFLLHLIEIYKEDFPSMLNALKKAIEGGEPSEIEAQAHGIKSGIVNIGAEKVAKIALTMEKEASGKVLENMQFNLGKLEEEIALFYQETEKLRHIIQKIH